jgi:hypothetical protein
MLHKKSSDSEWESIVEQQKAELLETFEENFKTQEKTLSIIVAGKRVADSKSKNSNQVFWNAAGFVNISSYDLKVIVKEMIFASNEWTKRYFARQACHLIYELIKDFFEILGTDFTSKIDQLSNKDELRQSLANVRKKLNEFKGLHFVKLQEIRNVSSAHRDKDILVQLDVIQSINWVDTFLIAKAFDDIVQELGGVMQAIIDKSSIELDR